jgi:2,4-dienoyl-CoA reductase-like NADH-dependent reductase (Old Yellow Enzyme family)/thioredoxin reductase
MQFYRNLFSPGRIGNLLLKNRIVMPPIVTTLSKNGAVTPRLIHYYAERARGGAGMIVVESTHSSPQAHRARLSIADDETLSGMKRLVDAVHDEDSKIAIEINISRGRADYDEPVAASDIPHPVTGVRPRAVSVDEIEQMVREFGESAKRAKEAGFDAVMIHGAHGYLVTDFLSARTNLRHDKYGGDVKGRATIALELVRAARESTGSDYPLIFRISASERVPGGFELDEAIEVCQLLEREGVDALGIVSGTPESMEWIAPYMSFPRGYNVQLAEEIKKRVNIPVLVAGKIKEPGFADEIIEQRKADFVDLGRALIADPHFPIKAAEGKSSEIRYCIGCLRCWESFLNREPLSCTVNPALGKEKRFVLKPTTSPKKVYVVGAGPAGMQAAIFAEIRGHKVTLWEKEKKVGGQLRLASTPSQKKELGTLTRFLENQLEDLKIDVRLGKEIFAEKIIEDEPDVVVLATGARPKKLDIPGTGDVMVLNSWELLSGDFKIGKKVVVLGAGLTGCEVADLLSEMGVQVCIVEVLGDVANDAIEVIRIPVKQRLLDRNIRIFCGVTKERIVEGGLEIEDKDGHRHFLEADQIITTPGAVSNKSLKRNLAGRVHKLYEIGDCKKPRRILEAIHEGAKVGLRI